MPIDYRDLLRRYMQHVYDVEGSTFVLRIDSLSGFSDEERDELERIAEREIKIPLDQL